MAIVLSSSPPTSQDASRNNETTKKIARHGLCTPTKYPKGIWEVPSSSPLPSPGALLRGLLQPKAWESGPRKVGRSFKTAMELLETEEQRGDLLFGVGDNQHTEKHAATVSEGITTQAKSVVVSKKRARAPRKTVARSQEAVKRAATASSHFSKKSKTSNANKSSKGLSPMEPVNSPEVRTRNKTGSSHADVTKPVQERSKDIEAEVDGVPMLPVPARRRDWTPVEDTVPVVEIISSPMARRNGYETDLEEAELEYFTTGTSGRSISSKRSFRDKIGPFKFDSGSTSAPSIGAIFATAGSLGSTTRRCIQMLEKPHLTRSISSLTEPTKISGKRARKKAKTITDLATAQYRTREEDKPRPPSVVDFLTDRRRGRKASKNEVDEPIELLSPQSAIRRMNEQQVIFGTFSQLTNGKVDTFPSTEASGPQKPSNSFKHKISSDSQLAKARSARIYGNTMCEGAETLEEFLCREFDAKEVAKAKNSLKRKGLWEAASRGHGLIDIDFVDLSKSKVYNEELELSLLVERKMRGNSMEKSPTPISQDLGHGRKSRQAMSEIEMSVKQSATPPIKKRKKDLSVAVSNSIPLAVGIDVRAPDIVPSKGKKLKGKSTKHTAGSPQSGKKKKKKKRKQEKKGKSSAKSSAKRQTKSPMSSPASAGPDAPPSSHHKAIYSHISEAITSEYYSTNDIAKSWHYKILTYEPIILEDLTAWLNTVGLRGVGRNDQVSPSAVKAWAEARSIVNASRETQHGGDRKRF